MNDIPKYLLKRIPNDEEGQAFVATLKKYLHKDRFTVRVRGQGLVAGQNWRHHTYGAPLKYSTHLRVYVEDKIDVKKRNSAYKLYRLSTEMQEVLKDLW
jgi:hypothetical protein|tara:strand:+ start:1201 stop:1497 length:297 start_codon:yes stop_codon:yes gene_type:complete